MRVLIPNARLWFMLAILTITVLIPRINTVPGYAQGTALGTPPGPSVAFDWTGPRAGRIVWSGPGLLAVVSGGQPYPLSDPAADSTLRSLPLGPGGDVRAAPHAGMVLAVVDAEHRVLASVTLPPPPAPTASPTPTPAVVPRRYLPVLLRDAALP